MILFKWALGGALLSELLLTRRLWTSNRGFPTVPVHPAVPELPQSACLALVGLLVMSVLLTAVLPRSRLPVAAVPAIGAVLVVFDINRLQPWFYQYLLMFSALSLTRCDEPESRRSRAAWAVCALIMASVYFWSGIQKANPAFARDIFPWLIEPLARVAGESLVDRLRPLAWSVPVLEVAFGILLLLPRTRTWGLAGSIGMHGLILLALGPLGHDHNSAVWPWNFWMPILAFLLFWQNRQKILALAWRAPAGKVIAALVGVMPALNLIDRWDDYLSASLYSGRYRDGWIMLNEKGARRLQGAIPSADDSLVGSAVDGYSLDLTSWAMSELNVPPYPQVRVYQGLARKLHQAGVPLTEMELRVRERPDPLTGEWSLIKVPME